MKDKIKAKCILSPLINDIFFEGSQNLRKFGLFSNPNAYYVDIDGIVAISEFLYEKPVNREQVVKSIAKAISKSATTDICNRIGFFIIQDGKNESD